MQHSSGQVAAKAAEVYESFFVPALFAEWAPRVADRLELGAGERALDVACGTGVLTRELANRLGTDQVTGLDCNAGMLAVARDRAPALTWREGDAVDLPFDAAVFDAVTCQFGLMFFADRVAALREMWRTLAPGGRLAIVVWASLDETPGYEAMVHLLAELFGPDIANELRAPFCLGDRQTFAALFADAEIPDVTIDSVVGEARFPSIAEWVRTDIRGWTLAGRLDDEQLDRLLSRAPAALDAFADAGGAVRFASPAHIALATKPSSRTIR